MNNNNCMVSASERRKSCVQFKRSELQLLCFCFFVSKGSFEIRLAYAENTFKLDI